MSAMIEPEEVTVDTEEPNVIVRVLMTHNRAIDDFLADCRARGWSERTIKTYDPHRSARRPRYLADREDRR